MIKFKNFKPTVAVALMSVVGLSGCTNADSGTLFGSIIGASLGIALGGSNHDARVMGGVMGGVIGASIGNSIGKKLDEADRIAMESARFNALEHSRSGTESTWYNPDSGHKGTYIPQAAKQDKTTGQYCREYQQTITIGGKNEEAYGKACRQADGSWKIIS